MADKVLVVFEKPIYLCFEPVDPHLFNAGFGVVDTPVEVSILLRESAVTYAVRNQDVTDVRIAGVEVVEVNTSPGRLIEFVLENGAQVVAVEEDLKSRGIDRGSLVAGVNVMKEAETVDLIDQHDAVMVW